MSTVTVRLNQEEESLFNAYAKLTGEGLSTLFKRKLAEAIEDEYDLKVYKQAKAEFEADPVTYSMEEVKKELGL